FQDLVGDMGGGEQRAEPDRHQGAPTQTADTDTEAGQGRLPGTLRGRCAQHEDRVEPGRDGEQAGGQHVGDKRLRDGHAVQAYWWSMIFSEKRYLLFGIMLYRMMLGLRML